MNRMRKMPVTATSSFRPRVVQNSLPARFMVRRGPGGRDTLRARRPGVKKRDGPGTLISDPKLSDYTGSASGGAVVRPRRHEQLALLRQQGAAGGRGEGLVALGPPPQGGEDEPADQLDPPVRILHAGEAPERSQGLGIAALPVEAQRLRRRPGGVPLLRRIGIERNRGGALLEQDRNPGLAALGLRVGRLGAMPGIVALQQALGGPVG